MVKVRAAYLSRLHHIGLGSAYRGQRVTVLIANKDIRVITAEGELIRSLTLDPTRDYQPLATTSGPPRNLRDVVRHVSAMS